jgi:hypothetical protein
MLIIVYTHPHAHPNTLHLQAMVDFQCMCWVNRKMIHLLLKPKEIIQNCKEA